MANSMLTMPYMTSLLHQAKTRYTITDKSTGEVLGYAFMIVDGQVMLDQVRMVPWHAQNDDLDRVLKFNQPTSKTVDDDEEGTIVKGRLASDLDISQDSSINATEEEVFSSPGNLPPKFKPVSHVDNNANNFKTGFVSTKEEYVVSPWSNSSSSSSPFPPPCIHSPTFPSALSSVTQSLAAQIAAKIMSEAAGDTVKSSIKDEKHIKVEDSNSDDVALGHEVVSKRKSEAELVPVKKMYFERTETAGKVVGKYRSFYSEVAESQTADKFRPRNTRKVRCLLCTDGRILSIGNFGEHCKAYHEPPVECPSCGGEFRAIKIGIHMKKCGEKVPKPDKLISLHGDTELSTNQDPIMTSESGNSFHHGALTVGDSKTTTASSKDDISSSDKEVSGKEEKVPFTLSSVTVKGIRYKVELRKGSKIKKALKKFGKKFKVNPKELKFTVGGEELSGKEVAGRLEGRQINVWGELK